MCGGTSIKIYMASHVKDSQAFSFLPIKLARLAAWTRRTIARALLAHRRSRGRLIAIGIFVKA